MTHPAERPGAVPFYVTHAREAHGAVLVVGCGEGEVLLPVAKSGADADGVEADARAAQAVRAALAERGLVAEIWVSPLQVFTCRRRHAGVLLPGPSLGDAATLAGRAALLRACRAALAPGGWLVGDLVPDAVTPDADALRALLTGAGFGDIELWGDFCEASWAAASPLLVWRATEASGAADDPNPA